MSDSVFLSPLEQDLIELDRALLAVIDRYQHVEQRLADHRASPVLDTIRSRLHQLEDEHDSFRQILKARDLLPHAPESDLEDIKRIAASIKAWIESDESQALLNWLIETEEDWQQTLRGFESSELEGSRIKPLLGSAEAAVGALSEHQDSD
jgi:hypothetical protein